MSAETHKPECPCCTGTNLVNGKLGGIYHTFIPAGRWMLRGYISLAFVCLDCGFMGHFLDDADVQDLRRRQAKKNQ